VISVNITGLLRLCSGRPEGLLDYVQQCEGVGVGEVAIAEHAILSADDSNKTPYALDEDWPDPFIVLTAVAGATRQVRLATNITVVPIRPAISLAKTAATLDVVSGGRLDLGVGSGWQAGELAAAGVEFTERRRRMVDTVRACQALWTGAPASFDSETVSFSRVWSRPTPRQTGGIPVWFAGGPTPSTMRLVAEHGVGWTAPGRYDDAQLAAGAALLKNAFVVAGRDPATAEVRASIAPAHDGQTIAQCRPRIEALYEAGTTRIAFWLERFVQEPGDLDRLIDELGELIARVRPAQ
jgi:probable F420-dependent oxidoreductase